MLILFPLLVVLAVAQTPDPSAAIQDPLSQNFWGLVSAAISGHHWGAAVALVIALGVYLLRFFGAPRWPILATSTAGGAFAAVTAALVVAIPGLLSTPPMSAAMLIPAIITAVFATFGAWNGVVKPLAPAVPPKTDVEAAKILGQP